MRAAIANCSRATSLVADADEFIKLVARGLNRYNIIKRETCIQLKNITIRLTKKRTQLSE